MAMGPYPEWRGRRRHGKSTGEKSRQHAHTIEAARVQIGRFGVVHGNRGAGAGAVVLDGGPGRGVWAIGPFEPVKLAEDGREVNHQVWAASLRGSDPEHARGRTRIRSGAVF